MDTIEVTQLTFEDGTSGVRLTDGAMDIEASVVPEGFKRGKIVQEEKLGKMDIKKAQSITKTVFAQTKLKYDKLKEEKSDASKTKKEI